jgi:hypothetical protein
MTRTSSGLIAIATALAAMGTTPATAQVPTPTNDVSVAIVDLGANRLYSPDPNVTFVDLTPTPREGFRSASSKVGGRDHGEIVAQAFVQEYRRIDPKARITIYTINPFIEKSGGGQMMLSRSMLKQALPRIDSSRTKVAITTFGVSNEKAGTAVLDDLRSAGLVVFAATPNKGDDDGIWPAASPGAIAVGDGVTPDSPVFKQRSWAKWIDVVANGQFHKDSMDVDGSSFATPRAAAYGVSFMTRNPKATTEEVKSALVSSGDHRTIGNAKLVYVGADAMVKSFAASAAIIPSKGMNLDGAALASVSEGVKSANSR